MPTLEKRVREVFLDTFHEGGLVGLNKNLSQRIAMLFLDYIAEINDAAEKEQKAEETLPIGIEQFIANQEKALAQGRDGR